MKRIILIVTIALLPALSACFVCRVPIDHGQVKTKLVPKVSEYGTLIGLKDKKGRRLFKKPIQEGYYVRYCVGNCKKEDIFYALGDRNSNQKAKYSGYHEEVYAAGATTKNGLNVTSWFVIDESNQTVTALRAF